MTQMTEEQQQVSVVGSTAAKFQAFLDGLTPDEQRALDRALQQTVVWAAEDATGHIMLPVGQRPVDLGTVIDPRQPPSLDGAGLISALRRAFGLPASWPPAP